MIAPLWFLGTGSLMKASKMMIMPPKLLPRAPTLDNYGWALGRPDIGTWIKNTALVTAGTVFGSVCLSLSAGYAFAMYAVWGKKILWAMLLAGLMIPRIALIIPTFVVASKMGIAGSIAAVILPCIFVPSGMYLARTFFESIPKSLIESARIDGASEVRILTSIVAPISKPLITSLALFSAIGALNDWIWQALNLQRPDTVTLMVGWIRATMQRSIGGNDINPLGHSMAVGVLLLLPLMALFIIANKYFVGSLDGAVKE
jgi:ABC-type glycerol-3-phosphate transport system permease component